MSEHLIIVPARLALDRAAAAAALTADLAAAGWTAVHAADGLQVWSLGAWPTPIRPTPEGEGILVGDVFPLPSAWAAGPRGRQADSRAEVLLASVWGAYVAVWPGRGESPTQVLRDPSGAREALIWNRNGLVLIASRASAPGLERWGPTTSVDRDQVARFLVDGNEIAGPLALSGVEAVTPGALWTEERGERPVWTPGRMAREVLDLPVQMASDALGARVDGVVQSWAGLNRPMIAEISGGLDSAVVAAALGRDAPVRRWLNFFGPTPESDERAYARSVAERLGVRLDERAKPVPTWTREGLTDIAGAPRPSLTAMDVHYDQALAAEAEETGAWGVMTGQGGDSVFLNFRSPLTVSGLVSQLGWRAVAHPEVEALAAELGANAWRVVRTCRRAARRPCAWTSWSPKFGAARELRDLRRGGPRHLWLRDLDGLTPIKRLQTAGYVQSMHMCAEARRLRVARQIHAPLQQPLMELGLRLPAERLAFGGRDRALARRAFADRLPPAVVKRRGKGDLTALYGRGLAASLPLLRERLLGGELRAMRLLDLAELEARLEPEALMWRGGYGDLMDLMAIEAWVADWRPRRPSSPAAT